MSRGPLDYCPLRPIDLESCLPLGGRAAYTPEQYRVLPVFWRDILAAGAGYGNQIVDPDEKQVLAFSLRCFVEAASGDALAAYERPYVGRALLTQWCAGRRPYLHEHEVAIDNATEGVNVLLIHNGVCAALGERRREVFRLLVDSFVAESRGLHLRSITAEVFDFSREEIAGLGATVHEAAGGLDALPREQRPFLMTIRRDDPNLSARGSLALALFGSAAAPQLNLNRRQRDLLRAALVNDDDRWIASRLDVSPSTIKKRWQSIYDAFADAFGTADGARGGKRGSEKRHHVLRYVRLRPEELHPYAGPARAARL